VKHEDWRMVIVFAILVSIVILGIVIVANFT
jgi:hypothetical protein